MIAERALFDLHNELTMSAHVYRGYNSEFNAAPSGYRKGSSVTVHLPNKFRVKTAVTFDVVDVNERSTTITVNEQDHVGVDFTGAEMTLSVEDFSRKYTKPAMMALANQIDYNGCNEYKKVYNLVGTAGTTPATFRVIADAAERLDNESCPRGGRVGVLSPKAYWALADGELKGVFQQNMVDTLIRKGFVGMFAGFDWFMDQNIRQHTTGTFTTSATPVMNGSTAEGATTLVTDGWNASSSTIKEGDVFTVATVVAVNPIQGQIWEGSTLRQFVARADYTSAASAITITVAPQIYSSSATEKVLPYQSVNAVPANEDGLTFVGTEATAYPQNLAFHPDCFALTVVPLRKPNSAGSSVLWAQANDPLLGLSLTLSQAFSISTYAESTRIDALYGWDTPRPELGVRIIG
jgi:hypothetical protein